MAKPLKPSQAFAEIGIGALACQSVCRLLNARYREFCSKKASWTGQVFKLIWYKWPDGLVVKGDGATGEPLSFKFMEGPFDRSQK